MKTKRIKFETTNRVNGMLEQGGVCERIVSYPCWLIAQIMDRDPQDVQPNDGEYTAHALKSAHDALLAIANMQITENTDKGEVLALCMSIARLELEKCSTVCANWTQEEAPPASVGIDPPTPMRQVEI